MWRVVDKDKSTFKAIASLTDVQQMMFEEAKNERSKRWKQVTPSRLRSFPLELTY